MHILDRRAYDDGIGASDSYSIDKSEYEAGHPAPPPDFSHALRAYGSYSRGQDSPQRSLVVETSDSPASMARIYNLDVRYTTRRPPPQWVQLDTPGLPILIDKLPETHSPSPADFVPRGLQLYWKRDDKYREEIQEVRESQVAITVKLAGASGVGRGIFLYDAQPLLWWNQGPVFITTENTLRDTELGQALASALGREGIAYQYGEWRPPTPSDTQPSVDATPGGESSTVRSEAGAMELASRLLGVSVDTFATSTRHYPELEGRLRSRLSSMS